MDVLTERVHVLSALVPLSRAMNTNSDIVNLTNYQSCSFIIQKGAGGVGTATITVDACDNTTPSNTAKAPFKYRRNIGGTDTWGAITARTASQSFVTTANANDMYEIIVDPAEIGAVAVNSTYGNRFCRVSVAQVDATAVDYGILAVLGTPRYPQNVPITGIA
jgi:hypothetical protein